MKSRPGSSDTAAYVFLISLFRTSTSISTSTAITPPQSRLELWTQAFFASSGLLVED